MTGAMRGSFRSLYQRELCGLLDTVIADQPWRFAAGGSGNHIVTAVPEAPHLGRRHGAPSSSQSLFGAGETVPRLADRRSSAIVKARMIFKGKAQYS
jgi:hypothetical protein